MGSARTCVVHECHEILEDLTLASSVLNAVLQSSIAHAFRIAIQTSNADYAITSISTFHVRAHVQALRHDGLRCDGPSEPTDQAVYYNTQVDKTMH